MKQKVEYATIDLNNKGQRIDNYLLAKLKGVPKSHIYRLLRKGEVRVNKGRIKPEYKLKEGDVVRIPPIRTSPSKPSQIRKDTIDQLVNCIIYEDADLLVLDKPVGIPVHGGSKNPFGVIEVLRQAKQAELEDGGFLELVHRVDKATSGCLLIAKKRIILNELHDLLQAGNIDKRYQVLVHGNWPDDLNQVDQPLMKVHLSGGDSKIVIDSTGKNSLTKFHVDARYPNATLITAKPITGRMHQIRVHTAYAGHPIVGDRKYGSRALDKNIPKCKRLMLHAKSISFKLESTGKDYEFTAPLEFKTFE